MATASACSPRRLVDMGEDPVLHILWLLVQMVARLVEISCRVKASKGFISDQYYRLLRTNVGSTCPYISQVTRIVVNGR